jgi:hypothetical protein
VLVAEHFSKLNDGTFGTTYKASARDDKGTVQTYVVQLLYHGHISMYHLIRCIRKASMSQLPVPEMFLVEGELFRGQLGVQVSRYVPGAVGPDLYNTLPFEGKQSILKEAAQDFGALWDLALPGTERLIGEATVNDRGTPSEGPERRYRVGRPFPSVTSYLQAWIRHTEYGHCSTSKPLTSTKTGTCHRF